MGRQISFVHSEADTCSFLKLVYKFDANIMIDNELLPQENAEDIVIDIMSSHKFQFMIIPSNMQILSEQGRGDRISHGTAVEFSNCRKGSVESHTYEAGRLYVSTWYSGDEQTRVLELFEKLRREIKKRYVRSPASRVYWGPDFLKHYNCGEYKATYLGKFIEFK